MNVNAAIDKTAVVNGFRINAIHRPDEVRAIAGGKGVNVARGLQRFGGTPTVMGWLGGFNGQFIEAGLAAEGIKSVSVVIPEESRTCLSILDADDGTITELYEPGPTVAPEAIAALKQRFASMIGHYAAVTLSGSLPPGVPSTLYADLLMIARAAGVPAFLDSSGEPLRQGLQMGHPALIKPNAGEFAELVGQKIDRIEDIVVAAAEVADRFKTKVVVSLGAAGAVAVDGEQALHVQPPDLVIKSAVGSGDCVHAGLVYGLVNGESFEDALRRGVAAGTANALSIGAGVFTLDTFEWVRASVVTTHYTHPQGQ